MIERVRPWPGGSESCEEEEGGREDGNKAGVLHHGCEKHGLFRPVEYFRQWYTRCDSIGDRSNIDLMECSECRCND